MEIDRRFFKIAGIMYGIMGVFLLFVPIYGVAMMLAGIYIYSQSNETEENLYKNRVLHYIISIVFISNMLSSILLFIAHDNIATRLRSNGINAPPKVIYKVDKESKKIDILLKLGVAMVFISGLLFATTSWDFISNYIKALALIVFGSLFLFLSLFTEKKLKLYRSSYMYWLLSMSLFLLTIVGILYFGIFGTYLTYSGGGSDLAYAITFLTGAGFAITTYYKFPKKYLQYLCYICIVTAVAYIFAAMHLSQMMDIAIISLFVMLVNIIHKRRGTIYNFSKILSYMLFGFIIIATSKDEMEVLISCLINVVNLNYLTFIDKNEDESLVNILLTYILIFFGVFKFIPLGDCRYIMAALTISIYTLLINGNVIPTKSLTAKINYVTYFISMFSLFVLTVGREHFDVPSTSFFISFILLTVNTMIKKGLFKIEAWKAANYVQPLLVFCLIDAIVIYFHNPINVALEYAVISVVFCVMNYLYKDSLDKKITYVYLMVFNIISILLQNSPETIASSLIVIGTSLYQFVVTYLEEENKSTAFKLSISYLVLLTSLYLPFVYNNILEVNIIFTALIFIGLTYVIAPLLKNEWIKKISYLYIIFPLTSLINMSGLEPIFKEILSSITGLYVVFLIIKFFIKDKITQNVIAIVGTLFFIAEVFFEEDFYVGLYIGILGLIIILLGYRKDDLFPVFIMGIVITILNIIYRLKEVWKLIPFWLYLLVGGLAIITFVTYRELKKQNNKKETKSNE